MTAPARRLTAVAAAVAAGGTLAACGQSAQAAGGDELVFAAVPAESSSTLQQSFEPIVELLSQATGKEVVFQNVTDYASVIEGQRAGKIDIASYGPFSYVIAREAGVPVDPVVASVDEAGAVPSYNSVAYALPGSGITDLAGAQGKRVCFVDRASTSGHLAPLEGLAAAGLGPGGYSEVIAGSHDASVLSLVGGQCDVAFTHNDMLTTLERSGQLEPGAVEQVWQSAPLPEDPIVVNRDTVDDETREAIVTALRERANKPALVDAGICPSEDECTLPEETEWGYTPVDDADYDAVRRICEVTKAEACA
ncbi:phosphate/phosphite/phosphonate ABC transporter substrate-binding protein [Tomitella fengzijianii]|uniref:Phosphate/phosphite/phosphonate ABC transporter substrate-binding protein n=2 Tax=Tomitella fengzijianii TaxID=2597660 RepID=A0A516X8E5_9ACTN|nr:phosphate/phosphite/phosphonate ABC transporter substrate-binding protein [Tomitella fengzijianii]